MTTTYWRHAGPVTITPEDEAEARRELVAWDDWGPEDDGECPCGYDPVTMEYGPKCIACRAAGAA